MRSHFFLSNKENGLTDLYVYNTAQNKEILANHQAQAQGDSKSYFQLDPVKLKNYDRHVYYPKKFETLSMIEIEEYKKSVNWRFYKYYYTNRNDILKDDYKTIGIKLKSFYVGLTQTAGLAYSSNALFQKIDVPFFSESSILSKIQTNKLRYASVFQISAKVFHLNYSGLLRDNYIYDIALGYKQNIQPKDELVCPNSEDKIPTELKLIDLAE